MIRAKHLSPPGTAAPPPLNPHRSREKTVDKYDRLAAEIVFKHFGAKADMSLAAVIAAALRESAAEAFEEAATMQEKLNVTRYRQALKFRAVAAALRSTTRGK